MSMRCTRFVLTHYAISPTISSDATATHPRVQIASVDFIRTLHLGVQRSFDDPRRRRVARVRADRKPPRGSRTRRRRRKGALAPRPKPAASPHRPELETSAS